MARSASTDPVRNFKFQVQIQPTSNTRLATVLSGIGDLGFAAMTGVSVQHQMVGYREGGMNTHTHKLVGQSDFGPVTFSRGVIAEQSHLWKWSEFIHSWNQAAGNSGSDSTVANGNDYRCHILVRVFDHPHSVGNYQESGVVSSAATNLGKARLGIKLFNCWPGAYTLSDLSAGDSGIVVQQLTVHHEGFKLAWTETDITALASVN
jgi:phage tail-like protein